MPRPPHAHAIPIAITISCMPSLVCHHRHHRAIIAITISCMPSPPLVRCADALFFDGRTIHGSEKNTTDEQWRRTFICHFVGKNSQKLQVCPSAAAPSLEGDRPPGFLKLGFCLLADSFVWVAAARDNHVHPSDGQARGPGARAAAALLPRVERSAGKEWRQVRASWRRA